MVLFINLFKRRIIFNIWKQQYLHIPMPTFSLWNSTAQARASHPLRVAGGGSHPWATQHRWSKTEYDLHYVTYSTCLLHSPILKQRKDLIPTWKNATGQEHAQPLPSSWQVATYIPIYLTTSVSHVWILSSWFKPLLLTEGAFLNLMRTRRCSSICNHNKNKQLLRP